MATDVTLRPASELCYVELTELFNRSFVDYFVKFEMTPEILSARLTREHTDLALSRVAYVASEPVGFILVSVRGRVARGAGMGIVPEARRRGVGRRLVEAAVELARENGFERLLLEVVQQNEPAVTLYREAGFEVTRPLVGYELAPDAGPEPEDGDLAEVGATVVAREVASEGPPDLPWQLDAPTLAGWGPAATGYVLGGADPKAWALVCDGPGGEKKRILALCVARACRLEGWGRRLVAALRHRHPGYGWEIPALVPEDVGDAFLQRLGFVRGELLQFEMERRL